MKIKQSYSGLSELTQAMSFIEKQLDAFKADAKAKAKTLLLAEEAFVELCKVLGESEKISIYAVKRFGKLSFTMQAKGLAMDKEIGAVAKFSADDLDADEASEAAIRNMILNANSDILKISYKNGINIVNIKAKSSGSGQLKLLLGSLVLAVVFGFVLRFMPVGIANDINELLLIPVRTIILNILQMIIGPMVFFSIASSVGQFTDFKMLGKTGARVIAFYMFTTVVAVVVSIVTFYLLKPGQWGVFLTGSAADAVIEAEKINVIETLIDAVPYNFVLAFAENNTLQIIILAILFGIAASMLGNNSEKIEVFFSCGSDLVLKLTELITKVLPVMIFVSFSSLIFTTDNDAIFSLIAVLGNMICTDIVMVMLYSLMVMIIAKKNPFWFLANAAPAWLNAFALSSSNASISFTMDTCKNRFKVSPKICSFSIPLGATINMDGTTICLVLSGLFFARGYGINVGLSELIGLGITAMILSVSTPGVPGASIMCCTIICAQLGIPVEALTLFIAINTFIDPFDTADNVMGDIAGTYCVAHLSGMIDEQNGDK